jgi:hypothetical protein
MLKNDTRKFYIEYQSKSISGDRKFMAVLEDKAEIVLVAVHPEPASEPALHLNLKPNTAHLPPSTIIAPGEDAFNKVN